jgi:hypothetical protein
VLDLLLVMSLGFLGSFGHCVGMCGPLSVAFSLSQKQTFTRNIWRQIYFHSLLNLGRIISYALVGAAIGTLGSVLVASGQLAGIDSNLRRGLAIGTGIFLIWMGTVQLNPQLLPKIPFVHPMMQKDWQQKLNKITLDLSFQNTWLTPALLGMTWGLIPCGFLYAAQIKAAETGEAMGGALTMFAFGLGTVPSMIGIGISTSLVSVDRRSQLFRLGGWLMLIIGGLTLWRTGEMSSDLTGHGAIILLMLTLIARPISHFWDFPLRYRRVLGVSSFYLAIAHITHAIQHSLNWNLEAISFMLPEQQWALWAGAIGAIAMLPAACTSFDRLVQALGKQWRRIHLLNIPALILCVIHTIWLGSHYLGTWQLTWRNWFSIVLLISTTVCVFLIRLRGFWKLLSLEKFYVPILKDK